VRKVLKWLLMKAFFIIMGIDLPGIDGVETTKKIRSSGSKILIIAITSYAMAGDRERILAAGCNGYFEKPIDPTTIVNKIHKILGVEQK
jgi:CheY-like chemotaxis protein